MNILAFVTSAQLQQQNFENAQIKNITLTAQFQDKKVKIQLPTYTPAYYKKSRLHRRNSEEKQAY